MIITDPVVLMWQRYQALIDQYDALPEDEAHEAEGERLFDEWHEIRVRLANTPAQSLEGAMAKLRLLRSDMDHTDTSDDYHKRLLDSAIAAFERIARESTPPPAAA